MAGATILFNVRRFAFFAVAFMAIESVASAAPSDESAAPPSAPAAPGDAVTAPNDAPSDKAAAPADRAPASSNNAAPSDKAAPSETPATPPPAAAPVETPSATAPTTQAAADVADTNESWKVDPNQKTKLPWHGTTLSFDQSVSTTTVGVGSDYQSFDPVYEWWLAFRPRYSLYESKRESFSIGMWFNLYLELTNSDSTTTEHEPAIGPTWVTATYGRTLAETGSYKTSITVGPRIGLPTDKASRDSGQILALGAQAGLSQRIPVAGKDAFWFSAARFGLNATYGHPINRANVPVNGDIHVLRQAINDSRTIVSDVLRGTLNVADLFNVALSGNIQIIPDLDFTLSYSFLYSWVAGPTNACIQIETGCVTPSSVEDPSTFRASNWLVASLDYDLSNSFTLSTGYYNLTSQLGANAKLRQPLVSPESRFFFTITANLDAIYENLSSKSPPPKSTAHR
jgi:hypothetical protein